jgi:hypothetical protein
MEDSFETLAVRTYHLGQSEKVEVTIRLGKPHRETSGFHRCDYEYSVDGDVIRGHMVGLDVIDALLSALRILGLCLHRLNESKYGGSLTWEGGTKDLGLPDVQGHWPSTKA